jgi:hypothetical protein
VVWSTGNALPPNTTGVASGCSVTSACAAPLFSCRSSWGVVTPLLPVTTEGKELPPLQSPWPPGQTDVTDSPVGDGGGDGGGGESGDSGSDSTGVLKFLRRFVVVSNLERPEVEVADVMALVKLNGRVVAHSGGERSLRDTNCAAMLVLWSPE